MPLPIQNLSIEHLLFLAMVVTAFSMFQICLFAVWVYVNLGDRVTRAKVEISAAVRPSEAGADASGDVRRAA